MKMIDITGKKFNNLMVISFVGFKDSTAIFDCLCDCGNRKIVKGYHLRTGQVKSCGCLLRKGTHRMRKTRFYSIWCAAKKRCLNKNASNYHLYGGRGIKIEKRWLQFEHFFADMHLSYDKHVKKFGEKQTTLDRKNTNLGYFKNNVRWATYSEQMMNNRRSRMVKINGKDKNLTKLCKEKGLNYERTRKRLDSNMSIKEILNKKDRRYK